VKIDGQPVAIQGASFNSKGDVASQGTGGGIVSNIPDANTGVAVNSSILREACSSHLHRGMRLLEKLRPSNATNGSWLNWGYYIQQSAVVQSLWSSPNPDAQEIFRQVLGKEAFSSKLTSYSGGRVSLFLQLFTLKAWFDQRCQ
jgi:hypothetical protein